MRLFWVVLFFPIFCWAGLDEVVISTVDGQCALRYLTTYPKENWTIQTNQKNCEGGFVQGYGQVELYDAAHRLNEKLTGFFLDGYWLGDFMGQGSVLDRMTPAEHQQSLTFQLGQEGQATYVVQLRAEQEENRPYGPFTGCPDFRLMVVVPQESLFQEVEFQEKIANRADQYAHSLCSDLENITVFGATQLKPKSSDIVFQMSVDPDTQERHIIPVSQIAEGLASSPIELRRQSGEVLFRTDAETKNAKPVQPTELFQRTALAHLDVLSRLTGKPVKGKVIVHVKQLNLDGSALVDLPQQILLKNSPDLQTGWLEVSGLYEKGQMSVHEVKPCLRKWCEDVS